MRSCCVAHTSARLALRRLAAASAVYLANPVTEKILFQPVKVLLTLRSAHVVPLFMPCLRLQRTLADAFEQLRVFVEQHYAAPAAAAASTPDGKAAAGARARRLASFFVSELTIDRHHPFPVTAALASLAEELTKSGHVLEGVLYELPD